VGHVAADARVLTPVIDVNTVMASRARGRRGSRSVGCVAARALGMGHRSRARHHHGSQEGRLRPMTPDADAGGLRGEFVWLVTPETGIVPRGLRPRRSLVAGRACLARRRGRSVRLVTIAAVVTARVLRVGQGFLVVTLGARFDGDRRALVRMVARLAFGRSMRSDRRDERLGLGVAADARRSSPSGVEGVADETVRLLGRPSLVRVPRLLVVTAQANRASGIRIALRPVLMAVLARYAALPHMKLVTRALSVLRPRGRDLAGGRRLGPAGERAYEARHGAREDRQGESGDPKDVSSRLAHHAPPWQSRHGRSRNLSFELENPWPCGLPPGPPTR
jgi:hypothetical protein